MNGILVVDETREKAGPSEEPEEVLRSVQNPHFI